MNVQLDELRPLVHIVSNWRTSATRCGEEFVRHEPSGFDDRWVGTYVETPATCIRCIGLGSR